MPKRPEAHVWRKPVSVLREDGTADPKRDPKISPEDALHLYRTMALTRVVDERMTTLQRQGRIGFHIGSLGEEATIVASAFALAPDDFIFPCYREIGAALVRGFSLQKYVHNMLGTGADTVKGRQMGDHYSAREVNFGSCSSPVGTQIPQAVGFAAAARLRGDRRIALVFFGEGATSGADFHVGANFAGVMKAPVILLCRNNRWAISVPFDRQTASRSVAVKSQAYGIHGVQVDGNDALAVIAVTREAAERGRRDDGATLIECLTYRVGAHSTSDDPRVYRKEEEVEPWRRRDPIARFREYLTKRKIWSDREEAALRAELEAEVKAAIAVAEATPPPAIETMFEDVYAKDEWHVAEERAEALAARANAATARGE